MSSTVRTVKFAARESDELDGLTYQNGELYYDQTNKTMRLMDSFSRGGTKMATRPWVEDDLQTLNNTIAFTNTLQSTSNTTGAVTVAGGVGIVKNLHVGGNLSVDGVISLGNATNIANDFSVSTDRFFVNHITGDGLFAGTLNVASDFKVNVDKFVVTASTGNTAIAGTLDLARNFRVNTNKFIVSYDTGNINIAGDLTLAGSITTEIKAQRSFSVATNKFTVDYLTGNTLVAGTMGVTGLSTLATARVSDLTAGRLTYAGTAGRLKDSANLTWDETLFTVTGNQRVTGNLQVDGNFTLSGTTITLGDSNTDSLNITADLTSNITPDVTNTYDLGTSSKRWRKLWTNTLDVSGDTNFDGNFTIATDKLTVNATTGATVHGGNVTVNGTLTVNGPTVTTSTSNVTTTSSVIEVHTSASPLSVDDGKDLGVVIHYFKTGSEKTAFLGWKNNNQELVYYNDATVNLGTYSGTLGTIKGASLATSGSGSVRAEGSGGITTTLTSIPVLNTTATTINFGGAATSMNIGAQTGTTTIQNPTVVGLATSQDLWNTTATTINFGGASTATNIGSTASGTTTIGYDLVVNGDVQVKGGDLTTNQSTFNLINVTPTTVNFAGAATTLNIGASSGTTTVNNALTVTGSITVPNVIASGTTVNLLNTTATTINFAGAATTLSIGQASTATTFAGSVTALSLTESSSITLKENINPITNALALIQQLEGVTYDRKNGTAKMEAGLIAEAVDKVLPNIVKHDQDGNPEGINYTKLTAYLIEAVKELSDKLDKLSK